MAHSRITPRPLQTRQNTNLYVPLKVAEFLQSPAIVPVLPLVDVDDSSTFNDAVLAKILLLYKRAQPQTIAVIVPRLPYVRRGLYSHLKSTTRETGLLVSARKPTELQLKKGIRILFKSGIDETSSSSFGVAILCGLSRLPDTSQALLFQQALHACAGQGPIAGRVHLIGPHGRTVGKMLEKLNHTAH